MPSQSPDAESGLLSTAGSAAAHCEHPPLSLPPAQWAALRDAYADPPRAYHHFGHVEELLRQYDIVAAGPGWRQPAEVWLAVLYHDAIYRAGRKDNETRSAELAVEHIERWLPQLAIDSARVSDLIAYTARHGSLRREDFRDAADNADACHFLDADMSILAAEPARFAAYDREIAQEYRGRVPGWLYRRGRKAFFRRLLDSERIYLSDFFHARCEDAARRNLRAMLAAG